MSGRENLFIQKFKLNLKNKKNILKIHIGTFVDVQKEF